MGRLASDVVGTLPASGVTSAVALVGATGVAVGVGVVTVEPGGPTLDAASGVTATDNPAVDDALADRAAAAADAAGTAGEQVSRSSARPALVSKQRADKAAGMPAARQEVDGAVTETVEATDPRDIAMGMLADFGWSTSEFSCLDSLYMHESGWNPSAANPSSGAYGIPQALPGDKMATSGADWQTNPATQLDWGLNYIQDRYGSPCGAWSFWEANNWY